MRFPLSVVPLLLDTEAVRPVYARSRNSITPAPPSDSRALGCRGGRDVVCIQHWALDLFGVDLEVFSRTTRR